MFPQPKAFRVADPALPLASARATTPSTLALRALPLALAICAPWPAMVGAQVTYFQRPPTPEQLRAALVSPAASPAAVSISSQAVRTRMPDGSRNRGIVWNAGAAGTGAAGGTGAAASATGPLPIATATARPPVAAPLATAPGAVSPAAALPINFDLGSSRVDRGSLAYIETIASVMRSDPQIQLIIEGHTDDRGPYSRNMVLSWDRALGVFRALVESYGIDPMRLQPIGKGPLEPMPGTMPSDGANRRVQFRISG